jgi:hypothetical protein
MVAIVTELRKLGATVEEFRDYCVITPPKTVGCVLQVLLGLFQRKVNFFQRTQGRGTPL